MSLDVYLQTKEKVKKPKSSGIFIRENGQTVEISEEEWNKRYPDREPVKLVNQEEETTEVYSANITHNLGQMADAADIYYALWRPEEKGWEFAKDIIFILESGISKLKRNPSFYKKLNPPNGWGNYEALLNFAEDYLKACKKYPESVIQVSR